MYRSFVDLVFIILCALSVVLTESVSLRGLKTDPVDVGAEGAMRLPLDQMSVIVVGEGDLTIDGNRFGRLEDALASIAAGKAVVVGPESDVVSHHRIVAVWWDIHRTGRHVELGVRAEGAKERT
jgi:hypothetical protein